MTTWAILTGEYPPDAGGVSDYTFRVAGALAAEGQDVHVFAPGPPASIEPGAVSCHRLSHGFAASALGGVARAIASLPPPRRVLVQYVPHAFGYRSMNVPLCAWLQRLADPVDVMFHEVAYPWRPSPTALLSASHRLMAFLALRAADRVFVSTEAWVPLLRRLGARGIPRALPVYSTLPQTVPPRSSEAVRVTLQVKPGVHLVGHFGTFGRAIADSLTNVLERLLRRPGRMAVLVGRGSREFAEALVRMHPHTHGRICATGGVAPADAAVHLAACDLLIQPYPDGITTRRSSAMAGLALGVPVLMNAGPLTEPIWLRDPALAVAADAGGLVERAEALLADSGARARAAAAGHALYADHFALERTISALLEEPPAAAVSGSPGRAS